jgi:uncharacterized protein DUF1841
MPLFDTHTRDELRRTYADAWRKHLGRAPLTPLEATIVDLVGEHPEYQTLVGDEEAAKAFEPDAATAAENPFMHLGLHLAVRDQLSIDRPPGICEMHRLLRVRYGDAHRAEHALMEALGETLWQAQRDGRSPDESHYLMLARRHLGTVG